MEDYPSRLTEKIMTRIAKAQRRRILLVRIPFAGGIALLAGAALFPAIRELQSEASLTGFVQFLSLLNSDGAAVLANWKDFGMLLLESLPTLGVGAVLLTFFSFFASMLSLLRDITLLKPLRHGT